MGALLQTSECLSHTGMVLVYLDICGLLVWLWFNNTVYYCLKHPHRLASTAICTTYEHQSSMLHKDNFWTGNNVPDVRGWGGPWNGSSFICWAGISHLNNSACREADLLTRDHLNEESYSKEGLSVWGGWNREERNHGVVKNQGIAKVKWLLAWVGSSSS